MKPNNDHKKNWVVNTVLIVLIVAAGYAVTWLTGCAPLHWAVTQDPTTGSVPAIAALPEAVDGGLSGLVSGGIFGLLAFIGTYGKTLARMYKARRH